MGLTSLARSYSQKILNKDKPQVASPHAPKPATQPPPLEETLDTLTKFIPTETIVLYIAALSLDAGGKFLGPVFFYWLFAALSPVILYLLILSRRKKAGLSLRIPIKDLPIWKLTASTIAFLAWGLAVPSGPSFLGQAIAAFVALFVSIFLGLLDRIFDKPLP